MSKNCWVNIAAKERKKWSFKTKTEGEKNRKRWMDLSAYATTEFAISSLLPPSMDLAIYCHQYNKFTGIVELEIAANEVPQLYLSCSQHALYKYFALSLSLSVSFL